MAWTVEQQTKSGLGQIVWLKVAGPFERRAQAELVASRIQNSNSLPARVVSAPQRGRDET